VRYACLALVLAGCAASPPQQLAALPEAELCYGAAYAFGSGSRAAYAAEVARRGIACDPAAVERERVRRIHAANEQPPPYYYGGPP
jgi:hypothetical protein